LQEKNWLVTVADSDLKAIQQKVGEHVNVHAVAVDVKNSEERKIISGGQILLFL
jgi:hypothetical protein